jgi:antitoxin PrlF
MNFQTPLTQEARIVSGGRLQIPFEIRRALGLKDGDNVVLLVEGGQLIVRPYGEVIRRIQERLAPYAPTDGTLLSEELIADRRAESERE